jgi:hypothetical protein
MQLPAAVAVLYRTTPAPSTRRPCRMDLRDALAIPPARSPPRRSTATAAGCWRLLAVAPALSLAGCAERPTNRRPPARCDLARAGTLRLRTDEALTRYEDVTSYNNFYEFGTGKEDPSRAAKTLRTSPWSVAVGGECARPGTVALEDLLRGLRRGGTHLPAALRRGLVDGDPVAGRAAGRRCCGSSSRIRGRSTSPSPPSPTRGRCPGSATARSTGRTARACASTRRCTR